MKFLRNYEVRITTPNGFAITIKPPITLVLEVDSGIKGSSLSNASLTITNLSPTTRARLGKDKFTKVDYWQIIIMAGYGKNLIEIFRGNIQESYSYKQNTEWFTKMECYDGAYQVQNGFMSETFTKDTGLGDAIKQCAKNMPQLLEGVLGSPAKEENTASRGRVVIGNPYEEIQKMTNGQAFIAGETLYVLADNEVMPGKVFVLSGEDNKTTPKRRDGYLEVDRIFSPELKVGRIAQVVSKEEKYNGQYKIFGVKHSVTFSQAEAGDAVTTVSLFIGDKPLQEIKS
jgi:hypothetical protein